MRRVCDCEARKIVEGNFSKQIEIDQIDVSQNHRIIDTQSLEFLALKESIQQQGLMQPPIVTPNPCGEKPFLCVAGHRRIAALKELHITKVTCTVLTLTDPAQIQAARLAENVVRENLKPLDLAAAVKALKEGLNVSSKGLARILNKDRAYLSRILRIADWPDDIKKLARDHDLNMRRLFLLAARNLPVDELRVAIQDLIHKRDKAPKGQAQSQVSRDAYFESHGVPEAARYWILRFLHDNKIRGWHEDIRFDANE